MQLTSLKIKNFRAITEMTIRPRNFLTLIGPNNCGKSSVLRAIEIFLNQESPTYEDWHMGCHPAPIEIEGVFEDLQDWEKLKPGVSGIVYENKIRLRVIFSCDALTEKVSTTYEAFKPEEEITGWGEKWGDVSEDIKRLAAEVGVTTGTHWNTKANKERVRGLIRERRNDLVVLSEARWTDDSISIAPALKQALPQAILVPAVIDAKDAAAAAAKSPYGKLLSRIVLPAIQASEEYTAINAAFEAIQRNMATTAAGQLEGVQALARQISTRIPSVVQASVKLTLEAPDLGKVLSTSAGLRVNDGVETSVDRQGHGLQRALVFGLIEVLAKMDALTEGAGENRRTTVLLYEEPELFLHPHLMRRLKRALKQIGESHEWQVVATTHSPFLINVDDDPQSLAIFRRRSTDRSLEMTQLTSDPFPAGVEGSSERDTLRAALNFHPTVCEAFFADRTILVEGDSEVAILRHPDLKTVCEVNQESADRCTVVSCSGKWTIPAIARLLRQFAIPFKVIHDQDRKGRTPTQLAAAIGIDPYRANAKITEIAARPEDIFMVEDTIEDILWPVGEGPETSRDKPYRAWVRSQDIVTNGTIGEHPRLKALVQFALNW